ncbi:MAG: hypothetical protein RLY80_1042 [Actinomycetota bacterium]
MSGFGLRGAPAAPEVAGWTHLRTGKVRDLYTNDKNELLIVASDRISAFDWVLPTEIPNKGKLLTQISLFWFELLSDIVPNHVISTDVPATVVGRAVIAKPLQMFAIECVARGYLTGSGWVEYKSNQEVCGNKLPAGLTDGSKLPESIFTPATKAEIGNHDININFAQAAEIVGKEDATELKRLTLALYDRALKNMRPSKILFWSIPNLNLAEMQAAQSPLAMKRSPLILQDSGIRIAPPSISSIYEIIWRTFGIKKANHLLFRKK